MSWSNRTYRMDGERRVAGTWRPIFINNGGTYYLTDLTIYADGLVDCWGLVNSTSSGRRSRPAGSRWRCRPG